MPEKPTTSPVDDALARVREVIGNRSQDYTDGHHRQVAIMAALFPNGAPTHLGPVVGLRLYFVSKLVEKLVRFCDNLSKPAGHKDSRLDLAGYAILLESNDSEQVQ